MTHQNSLKTFRKRLLYTLFDADSSTEITEQTLDNALLCVTKTIDKIMTGEIHTQDLIISKQLRMDITKYKNIFPHVAAAIQLGNANGKRPNRNDIIQYVYTDSQHQNPLNRVMPIGNSNYDFTPNYDREKYKEMLLDAAESVLGISDLIGRYMVKTKGQKVVDGVKEK